MTWLLTNTGVVQVMMDEDYEPNPALLYLDSIRGGENGIMEQVRREGKVNRYVLAKVDSLKQRISQGYSYRMVDYFRDMRDIKLYADTIAPWQAQVGIFLSSLTVLVDRDDNSSREEVDRARCEFLGDCTSANTSPINWQVPISWFLHQYLLGLLPAFLMCLILARQGRIRFTLKRSPVSSLLYLALWPINFGLRVIIALQDIDREARLRTEKDFLFSRLSGLEERFLESLRNNSRGEELLSTKRVRLSYLCAIVAVLVMKIVPVAAQALPETGHEATIEAAYHDPPSTWSDDTEHLKYPMCSFAFAYCISKASRSIVWWPSCTRKLLVGFGRSIEHVPLGSTA